VHEAWLFYPGATPSYERLTYFTNNASSGDPGTDRGLGRARVRMMQDPTNSGETTAFQSACLALDNGSSTYDGSIITTNIRIPAGNGSTSPFYTVVDVFSLATDCSGAPDIEFHFPTGIYQSFTDTMLAGGTPPYYTLFLNTE
jgi:hypothetical protein